MAAGRYEIGVNLKRLRKEAGYKSAAAFAEAAGLNTNTYTSYEQGRSGVTCDVACNICEVLGCTLDDLCAPVDFDQEPEDPDQERLVRLYQNMNERGRTLLLSVAESLEKDVANRVEKKRERDKRLA